MISLVVVVALFLALATALDIYTKKIPSIFLTGLIFMVALTNMHEVTFGMIHLSFGVIAFVFAYMLYEGDFVGGVADLKVITVIGMMCSTIPSLILGLILVLIVGMMYKVILVFLFKKKQTEEMAFLPVLLLAFFILWGLGGLI